MSVPWILFPFVQKTKRGVGTYKWRFWSLIKYLSLLAICSIYFDIENHDHQRPEIQDTVDVHKSIRQDLPQLLHLVLIYAGMILQYLWCITIYQNLNILYRNESDRLSFVFRLISGISVLSWLSSQCFTHNATGRGTTSAVYPEYKWLIKMIRRAQQHY